MVKRLGKPRKKEREREREGEREKEREIERVGERGRYTDRLTVIHSHRSVR